MMPLLLANKKTLVLVKNAPKTVRDRTILEGNVTQVRYGPKSKTVVLVVCCHRDFKPVVKATHQKASASCHMELTQQLAHCLTSQTEMVYLL